jgi:tRNA threonylcarbamoyladenosine modification (KEOPS) complex  Pcc1 subunit
MKVQVVVNIEVPSEKDLQVIMQALEPEIKLTSSSRSKVSLSTEGNKLILHLEAKDSSAMRAAVNSYLRLIDVAMKLHKFTK